MITSTITPGVGNRKPRDATKSLTITVTSRHIKKAVQCDGKHCVLANSFDDSNIGEFYDGVEVGITITKVTMAGRIIRYATPASLRPYIRHFDLTGQWNVPVGDYTFSPPSPTAKLGGRPNRWLKHRENTDGSGRDKMSNRAAPTRRISRCKVAA